MSCKVKIIIAAVMACVLTCGGVVGIVESTSDGIVSYADSDGEYSVSVGGTQMVVDKSNLHFTVTKDGKVWDSGKRASEEDGLNNVWVSKVTDAVTVGYRTLSANNTTERPMSRLNASVKFQAVNDGFNATINCKQIGLSLVLQVRLTEKGVTATVPFESITETNDNFRLQYLLIYPFFDSSYQLVDGQILLPDGSGAVIDLSQNTKAKQPYSARIYGADYGISATPVTSVSPYTASVPLFAMLYNDHGSAVVASNGAEYCSVNASVSSITTEYNIAYYNWIYRELYTKYFQSAGTDGSSYVAFQTDMNRFDLVQTMYFLNENCTVADVAKLYRENYGIKATQTQSDIGLRLSFLMSENKQGMFSQETVNMTSTAYAQNVVKEVATYCDNLYVSVFGYRKGGLSGSYPNHFPLDGASGGSSGYSALANTVKEVNARFAMEADFVKCYTSASVNTKNLALNMSNQFITLNDNRSGSSAKFYLYNSDAVGSAISSASKNFAKYTSILDYASIGNLLYSGYENSDFTRTDTIGYFQQALSEAQFDAYIKTPNSYLWSVCKGYLEMPVSSSGYLIETSSVPLLQMILSGSMEIYSQPFNLNYTGRELILRLIDYNVYPSFVLTEKDSIDLYGTDSTYIFTSNYDLWGEMIKSVYQEVNGVLSQVSGATVEARYSPANGVFATCYSNGVTVLVNYTNSPVTVDGVTIQAQSATAVN